MPQTSRSAVVEPPLLERAEPLDRWARTIDPTADGGRVLVVEGAAGIGKTRYVDEAARLASGAGFHVLRATAGELERELTFGVARDLFAGLAREDPDLLLAGHAELAAGLLAPSDARAGRSTRHPSASDEPKMLHALLWALANAAERQPVAVLVDDAQWSDPETLSWLVYLARRMRDLPAALLVATRPTQEPAIERIRVAGERVLLGQLSPHAVGELLDTWGWPDVDVAPGLAAACHAATGGNPFLLRELVRTLHETGEAPDADLVVHVESATPARIVSWIGLRLDQAAADAVLLARAAAVLPAGAALPVLATVADVDPDDAMEHAAELARLELFGPDPTRPAFAHPLVRAAAYERIAPAERARLHRRAADALAALDADPEQVAAQLMHAAPSGDPDVVARLRAGAARVLQRAVDEAAVLDDATRVRLHRELGVALARAGSSDAEAWLESAGELERDPTSRATDALLLGKAQFARARFSEALATFERGRRVLEAHGIGGELELELASGWASAVIFTPDIQRPEVAADVERLVRRSIEPSTVAQRVALGHMAGLEMLACGQPEVSRQLADTAWGEGALLRDAGPDEPALWAVTAAAFGLGDLDRVVEVCDAVSEAASRAGTPLPAATAACIRAFALFQRGDLVAALADTERALLVSESLGSPVHWETFLPAALSTEAQVLIARGELDRARRALDLDAEREAAWSEVIVVLPLLESRGHLALAEGRPEDALEWYRRSHDLATRLFGRDLNSAHTGGWRSGAVEALVQLGRRDEALDLATTELEQARLWRQPRATGRALRAVGRATGRDGIAQVDEAIELFADHGLRLEEAAALCDAGMMLRAAGRRTDARERLRQALDRADRIEAHAVAARAREELVVLGARPRRERTSGARSLTATERRVAVLAAEGLSNREIAEQLFVTVHAIRFHLRNAYAKLGVADRDDLAGALREA